LTVGTLSVLERRQWWNTELLASDVFFAYFCTFFLLPSKALYYAT